MDDELLDNEPTSWRYEWRVWGTELAEQRSRLERLGSTTRITISDELYLIGPNRRANAKIRDEVLESKRLVDLSQGFEQWRPDISEPLPARASTVARLLADLGLRRSVHGQFDEPDRAGLDDDVPDEPVHRSLLVSLVTRSGLAVPVGKRRHHFTLETEARAEAVEVTVHDRVRWSIAIESVDVDELGRLRDELGLDGINTSMHVKAAELATASGS